LVPFVAFCSEHFRVSHRRRSRCGAQEAVFQLFGRAENRYVGEELNLSVSAFETHSLPTLARCFPRSFTFYVAHPIRSIQLFSVFL
jgi:hypothetical protein